MGKGKKYCYICKDDFVMKTTMKDHQEEVHKEDIANTKVSSNTEDVVRSLCKVVAANGQTCGAKIKVTDMRNHTKRVHDKMTISEYKKTYNQYYYDLVELVLHQCGICEEYLLLDSDYIAQHLRNKANTHDNITHANYNAKYIKLMQSSSTSIPKNLKPKPPKETFKPFSEKKVLTPKAKTNKEPNKKPTGPEPEPKQEDSQKSHSVSYSGEEKKISMSQAPNPNVTIETFRALLDSLAEEGEYIRFPDLERILDLNI